MGPTEIVGTVATALGTLVTIYAVYRQRRTEKSRIKVEVNNSLIIHGPHASNLVLTIKASNLGNKSITLSSQGFILPDKKKMALINPGSDVSFPYELAPEKSCTVWIDAKELAHYLKSEGYNGKIKVIGFYLDQVSRIYKSRKWEFDIDEWL